MQRYLILLLILLFSHNTAMAKSDCISLQLNHADLRGVIQMVAEKAHLNLILSDEIQGTTSLSLNQVSWGEVMDLVLRTHGLAKRQLGKTIWVTKTTSLVSQNKQVEQLRQQTDDFAPLITRTIAVHYANAETLAATLKEKCAGLLSPRGHILADERTHVIWLSDTQKRLDKIASLIQHLDKPLQQVMIEARIVNVDRSFEKNLGLRLGIEKSMTHSETNESSKQNNANLQLLSTTPAATNALPLGLFVAPLGHGVLLDIALNALESEGKGECISNPKLLTQDQKTATIQSGEEIPFQEKTRSGATNVVFKKAVLSLEVTPRILPNQQLLMDLKVNQDSPGVSLVNDIPMIDTRQIVTQVHVKSGQTLVLGGILESQQHHNIHQIPWLSKIPWLGDLFQEHKKTNEQRELLVFITPTIVA